MSTINKTPNLGLTQYAGLTYPLFLGDYSKDMGVIDELVKGIEDDIAEIQSIIDTVSTQNINDLIARLSALEIKVDNNANIINSLLNSIAGLISEVDNNKTEIANVKAELETAKNDIDELKRCCDNVLSVLNSYGERLTTNETAIENVNTEIIRMKEDIIGNAQDIATVATQISNIIANKQDKLIAGHGIRIVDNVISSYGAGVVASYSDENLTLG